MDSANYRKEVLPIQQTNGCAVDALVYIASSNRIGYPAYRIHGEGISRTATEHGLPANYIAELTIMAPDKQAESVGRWFAKAEQDTDVFDRFISSWVALTIASKRHRTISGRRHSPDETDRDRIIDYFKSNAAKIRSAIHTNNPEMRRLASRRGTRGGTVVDGDRVQKHCQLFMRVVLGASTCPDEDLTTATAEILNRIRNNLFHGTKMYDGEQDCELLNLVTPLLMTIVRTCERLGVAG